MNENFKCLIILLSLFNLYHSYSSPLNLNQPNYQEVPSETFSLCDLSHDIFRNYCLNKGICYTLLDKDRLEQKYGRDLYSTENAFISEIYCSCSTEFTGLRCETPLNDYKLINQPIIRPQEQQNLNKVENKVIYTNTITENTIQNVCPPQYQCLNGGTCVIDQLAGPKCICKPEFVGLNCGQNKYCPDIKSCNLKCDFGYKRKNNCEICSCNCVNEENFFDEIKNTFLILNSKKPALNANFCKKPCKLGYIKDEFNCFKCECIEDSFYKLITTPSVSTTTTSLPLPGDSCPKDKCKPNEICKYFDANIYRCPGELMDCKPYEKARIIPICIPSHYNETCLDMIQIGTCHKHTQRFYFDAIDKTCKRFFYSGCNGNRNNFQSFEECASTCLKNRQLTNIIIKEKLKNIKINTQEIAHEFFQKPTTNSTTTKTTTTTTSTPPQIITKKLKLENTFNIEDYKTILIPNANINPYEYNLNKTNSDAKVEVMAEVDDSNSCQWVCELNCPFGYKLNHRTKCYKCECIVLNMTECGVPCFLEGTSSCLYSQRANSRPKCVCKQDYEGVYCQNLNLNFNFSVRVDQSFKLNNGIINEIKANFSKKISNILDIGTNHVVVNEIKNNLKDNSLVLRFSLLAPEYTNSTYFYNLVEFLQNQLDKRLITFKILNQELILNQNCDRTEELFIMDLNEQYFLKTNKLKQMIKDLKAEVTTAYRFDPESIGLIKVKLEPTIQVEFLVRNAVNDPEFCKKAYFLQNDIRSRSFTLSKLDSKYLNIVESEEKRLLEDKNDEYNRNLYLDSLTSDDSVYLSKSSETLNNPINSVNHLTTPAFVNHSLVFISVIVSSFLVLLFLVAIIIITQLRKKKTKDISSLNETYSRVSMEHSDKTTDFAGYFMPYYNKPQSPSLETVPRLTCQKKF